MKTLIVFPIFILFIISVVSVAGDTYYNGTSAFGDIGSTTNSSDYGLTYTISSNGTIIFNQANSILVLIHSPYYPNPVITSFYWSDINTIGEDGTITFNNGTAPIFIGYNWGFISAEWKQWAQVERLDGMTFNQYLQNYAIETNDVIMLGGTTGGIPINIVAIASILIIAGVVGITVMGSGLSETSQSAIIKGTVYLAFWLSLSVIAQPLITGIYFIGTIFYLGITIMYIYGFVSEIGFGGSRD